MYVLFAVKIVSVVGARPNYIKLVAVYRVFSRFFEHVVVDTGQHYDYEMNKVFYDQLDIPEPDYFLGIGSGSHGYQVGDIIRRTEEVLLRERPDLVVVYGDTNSTLGGALAAVKAGFKVAHVEAGLRAFDMLMPEEINRRVVDHISYLLFAPTHSAVRNLQEEKVPGSVFLTGDLHVATLKRWLPIAEERSRVLDRLGLGGFRYAVVTLHRVENVDNAERLRKLLFLVRSLAKYLPVVFPMHPRTQRRVQEAGLRHLLSSDGVVVTDPLGYIDFIKLLTHSEIVLTDSGGVQREAYLLRRPVVVLRRTTEWVELVEAGMAVLYDIEDKGMDISKIVEWRPERYVEGLLGDENAPQRIAEIISSVLQV